MKLTGTIAFHTDNKVDQAPISAIQREKGEIALDFNMFDDLYYRHPAVRNTGPLAWRVCAKKRQANRLCKLRHLRGAKNRQVLMGH